MRIDGYRAFVETLRNKDRKFPNREDKRFVDGIIIPSVEPSFGIASNSTVFTIGSCFAREVEDALVAQGVNVPTAAFPANQDGVPGRPNRILNQYNPGTMLQCVEAIRKSGNAAGIYQVKDGQFVDCLLSTGSHTVSQSRAIERRAEILELYTNGLNAADAVVITLGLTEVWYDKKHEIYLNETPPRTFMQNNEARFEMRKLDVNDCYDLTLRMIQALQAEGKNILLTVSPVPLQVTFCGGDAVVANSISKATLRVVADRICSTLHRVDYFPSYEIVTVAGLPAFGNDNVHVRRSVVEKIMGHLLASYAV